MELYCKNCDCHTNHKFIGNFKDGNRLLGRYICKECGTEQEDEPMEGEGTIKDISQYLIIETNTKPVKVMFEGDSRPKESFLSVINNVREG